MINDTDLLSPLMDVHANSQKQIFRLFAHQLASKFGLDFEQVKSDLCNLNGNDTACVGDGVMILHGWWDHYKESTVSFMRLKQPYLPTNTPDNAPVDIVTLLLSPRADGPLHLKRLAEHTRQIKDRDTLPRLRGADNAEAVESILLQYDSLRAAA